ncbi:5-formyltetrahydrofolate cyclo-ligase [Roseospira visakhapatnamensis]|uniref:5-formyltetrahydrofolate cyclo-ligase n=1 Tax=Roseospira visakhapatnamensis TaxID=390880 RepID=A0A7W6WAX1_9PROT|nr:5-formyltetrahydrofolate cyclo-ligase [Roseospira visakhapatnamensis]
MPHPETTADIDAAALASIAERKAALRARLLARRRAIPAEAAEAAARAVRDGLMRATMPPPGAVVAGYWPIRGELDPRPSLHALAARGHVLALPRTPPPGAAPRLTFHVWDGTAGSLAPGPFATRHPPGTAPAVTPDWLLVPLVGFDRTGARLGYGGGYYDRCLRPASGGPAPVAIGLAYACQEVGADDGGLPVAPHDVRLRAIVTERTLIQPVAGDP